MEERVDNNQLICEVCSQGDYIVSEDDGFLYCGHCNSRFEDIIDTGVADEDICIGKGGNGGIYCAMHKRKNYYPPEFSLPQYVKRHHGSDQDCTGPTEPADFGTRAMTESQLGLVANPEDYLIVTRRRYVLGIQTMFQLQINTLVDQYKVNPLVVGIVSSIWLRYLGFSGVFRDDWGDKVLAKSESKDGKDKEQTKTYQGEPRNIHNERMVIVWYDALKKALPMSSSLALVYLACHVAREPILPTDIIKWAIEGKLPYINAFNDIEKEMEKVSKPMKEIEVSLRSSDNRIVKKAVIVTKPSFLCPLSSCGMFRPSGVCPPQHLEAAAACMAKAVGLSLPPVNFYGIACRFVDKLGLSKLKIMPSATHIFEWVQPPELYLSTSESRIPMRGMVMAILIVAIRLLYNLNGLGKWEKSLSTPEASKKQVPSSSTSDEDCVHKFESEAAELLCNLEEKYYKMETKYEYAEDLPTYLQYCRDVVFAGPVEGDEKEEELIDKLWNFYQTNRKHTEAGSSSAQSQAQGRSKATAVDENSMEKRIRELKVDMEEHQFLYMQPRKRVKSQDYLMYKRMRISGQLAYIAHADYYILLRACAKAAELEVRVLHLTVLNLERQLARIEGNVDRALQNLKVAEPLEED